jgi:hypothetical protein
MGDDANNPRNSLPGKPDPLFWWIGSKQPGEHVGQHYPRPWLCKVLRDPYTGVPASPRHKFLLYVILPVVAAAAILAGVLVVDFLT